MALELSLVDAKIATEGSGAVGAIIAFIRLFYKDWKRDEDFHDLEKQIYDHATEDAKTYATRPELRDLREFIDDKFSEQNNLIISLIKAKGK